MVELRLKRCVLSSHLMEEKKITVLYEVLQERWMDGRTKDLHTRSRP